MAIGRGGGNAWYVIRNLLMAVMLETIAASAGAAMTLFGMAAIYIFAIALIIFGILSVGATGIGGMIVDIVVGALIIAFANKMASTVWLYDVIVAVLAAIFIGFIGFIQIAKFSDPYGEYTRFEGAMKVFSRLIVIGVFFGGVALLVGGPIGALSHYPDSIHLSEKAVRIGEVFSEVSTGLCTAGSVCWVIYTFLVLGALNENGATINDYND